MTDTTPPFSDTAKNRDRLLLRSAAARLSLQFASLVSFAAAAVIVVFAELFPPLAAMFLSGVFAAVFAGTAACFPREREQTPKPAPVLTARRVALSVLLLLLVAAVLSVAAAKPAGHSPIRIEEAGLWPL